jgi:hypothetical protein
LRLVLGVDIGAVARQQRGELSAEVVDGRRAGLRVAHVEVQPEPDESLEVPLEHELRAMPEQPLERHVAALTHQ